MEDRLLFAPDVEQDLLEAYEWYQERRDGLGDEFLTCVEACIQAILRNPESHTTIYQDYRRALVRRFPYSVFYEYLGSTVIVQAVFHNARNPEKWRRRSPGSTK
jgi:plasmid stabilization system protein ParE